MKTDNGEDRPEKGDWELRRAAVVGAGTMGTLLAAVLGRVMPVVLVCRNPDRASDLFRFGARAEGLIECSSRPITVSSAGDIPLAGGADVVFVATKTTAIASVAEELAPVLKSLDREGRGVYVVSFQNGIEPGRQLMSLMPGARVLRMVLTLGAVLRDGDAAHAVEVTMNHPPHVIGGPRSSDRGACERIASALTAGGLETQCSEDIEVQVWKKAIVNSAMNPVAALVNCTVGEVLAGPSRIIVQRLIDEAVAVACAEGVNLGDAFVERAIGFLEEARDHTPSMVEDIRGGLESEVGQLNRQIVRHANRVGVPVLTHEIIDALIETFDWKIYQRAGLVPN